MCVRACRVCVYARAHCFARCQAAASHRAVCPCQQPTPQSLAPLCVMQHANECIGTTVWPQTAALHRAMYPCRRTPELNPHKEESS